MSEMGTDAGLIFPSHYLIEAGGGIYTGEERIEHLGPDEHITDLQSTPQHVAN